MNNNYTIDELISGYYERELLKAEDIPTPKFTLLHKVRMNGIFRQFAKNKSLLSEKENSVSTSAEAPLKPLAFRKRLLIAALIIILLAFMTGFVTIFVSKGFKGVVYWDNTHIFAVNAEGCPSEIMREYVLSVVPEGFEKEQTVSEEIKAVTVYKNSATDQKMIFSQYTKSAFNAHISTEGYKLRETRINGRSTVYIEYDKQTDISSIVIWEDQDYILELNCDFGLEKALDLVRENSIYGF